MRQNSAIFILAILSMANAQTLSNRTCTAEGKFEIYDGTCQNFYQCIYDGTKYISIDISCSTYFDPTTETCDSATTFECTQTTMAPTTTEAPCYRYGRFAVQDLYCKKYYLCYWNGTDYAKMYMSCPKTLLFNPLSEKCVLPQNYSCPTS